MTNWQALSEKNLGLTASLGRVMASAKLRIPETSGPCLAVTSDYSGSHRGSVYEVYSVLVADLALCEVWRETRRSVRNRYLKDNRRMSYKGLNDRQRRRALGPFLSAANEISGICASLAVAKNVDTLFESDHSPINTELAECLSWNKSLFERALRIVHFVSFFIAGVSCPNQDVLWFTDEDEIAANPNRLTLLTKLWGNVMSHYTVHPLRHLRCGTTMSDDGSNEIEDLAAIPDLAAGALADLLGPVAGQLRRGVTIPCRLDSKRKATVVGQWLSINTGPLQKAILAIDRESNSPKLTISRIGFDDLSGFQSVHLTDTTR